MRVLVVNKSYRVIGGVDRYVMELTQLLERQGHQVIPFAVADPRNKPTTYADFFVTPIEFFDQAHRPPPWAIVERVIYSREARWKMAQLIEAVRPDVAHLHNIYHHISPSVLDTLYKHRIPVVMTLHDYKLICPVYSFWVDGKICERCRGGRFYHCVLHRCNHGSLLGSLLNAIEVTAHRLMHIYDKAGLFIAPSRFLLQKHVEHGLAADRFLYIPNFINLEDYRPCFEPRDYFAYVGRLTPLKGVGVLLEAVALLKPSIQLLIVGDGPSREELEEKAIHLGLKGVRFLGHQSGAMLRDLIANAMVVVVPSEWHENSPYVVLEALALGTPVVASNVGGIPEVIDDNTNGMLVPPGNPKALAQVLEHMLGDKANLSEMGRAGRERVEGEYSEKRHLTALSHAYVSVGAQAL